MKPAKHGRPREAHRVRVEPEFREQPDIEKLGRALIAIAVSIAEKKRAEEAHASQSDGEGDSMT